MSAIELAKALIACPSITPADAGCQNLLKARLDAIGFQCETLRFGVVENLWARFGNQAPLVVFAGHTDVVPPGEITDWATHPFAPDIRDGNLYGRGASDMKAAIAAMVVAVEQFLKHNPLFEGSIAFLLTSDEEGPAVDGTKRVMELLAARGEKIDYCLIGEPSSQQKVGDQIRIGRRGSLHGLLRVHGKQGHVAHPHLATNPIHAALAALDQLAKTEWDQGNTYFPATTFQISNLHAGTGALNVIPGHLEVNFNFRYGTASTTEILQARTEAIIQATGLPYELHWEIGALPFLTKKGNLISATQQAIQATVGIETQLSAGGGTSDGRFIAPYGAEVVELGLSHLTAHHIDEHISLTDLTDLTGIYERILAFIFNK